MNSRDFSTGRDDIRECDTWDDTFEIGEREWGIDVEDSMYWVNKGLWGGKWLNFSQPTNPWERELYISLGGKSNGIDELDTLGIVEDKDTLEN